MDKPKLSPADEKFIAKFLSDKLDFSTNKITRKNTYTGEEVELDPISAAVFDFVINLEKAMNIGDWDAPNFYREEQIKKVHPDLKITNMVSNFDRARSIARKMNPEAYYKLID